MARQRFFQEFSSADGQAGSDDEGWVQRTLKYSNII